MDKPLALPDNVKIDFSDESMLVPNEAAALMRVSTQMFRELIKSGEIRFIPWGNEKRVPVHELRRRQEKKLQECEEQRKIHNIEQYFEPVRRWNSKKKKH